MRNARFLIGLCTLMSTLTGLHAQSPDPERPCGFKIASCPEGSTCSVHDPSCPSTRGENCLGTCVPTTAACDSHASEPSPTVTPTPTKTRYYEDCGGERLTLKNCPMGLNCIDDPREEGCGMACDAPGICVEMMYCAGKMGRPCPEGMECYDLRDGCDPEEGGKDCGGICL